MISAASAEKRMWEEAAGFAPLWLLLFVQLRLRKIVVHVCIEVVCSFVSVIEWLLIDWVICM